MGERGGPSYFDCFVFGDVGAFVGLSRVSPFVAEMILRVWFWKV